MVMSETPGARRYDLNGLGELLPRLRALYPDKVALITRTREMTFAELDRESSNLAAALVRRGVVAGDTVSLFASNRWEWIVSYHAALKAGAVVNPLNVMLTAEEVRFVMSDAESSVLIASAERLSAIHGVLGEIASLKLCICLDATVGESLSFTELIAEEAPDFTPVPVDPASLACIAYTSGTTGHPKGAMQSHRSLVLNCAYTAIMHARSDDDLIVTALPCTHVYGNVAINGTLMVGGTVALMERFDILETLSLISERKATLFEGVPTMYAMLLNSPELAHADLRSLTRCTVGGQTIAETVIEAWERISGAPLIELWGMTELSGLGTTHAAYAPNVHGSVGVALPGTQLKVADVDEPAIELPAGRAGELMVRGPLVTMGYYNNQQATAEAIRPDGWLHTGDVAMHDGLGHFFVVDRLKDMILTGGYNVYPAEIERVMIGHDAVALVAVGREPDGIKGEVAHAYVVLATGRSATESQLIDYCRTQLAAYKVPRAVHFVDALPTTSSGKLMRRKLRELRPEADRQLADTATDKE